MATDPITISAGGNSKVLVETAKAQEYSIPNEYWAKKRSVIQNELIEDLGLTGRFYPNRLSKLLNAQIKS